MCYKCIWIRLHFCHTHVMCIVHIGTNAPRPSIFMRQRLKLDHRGIRREKYLLSKPNFLPVQPVETGGNVKIIFFLLSLFRLQKCTEIKTKGLHTAQIPRTSWLKLFFVKNIIVNALSCNFINWLFLFSNNSSDVN